MNKRGFTLVELLVTLAILGIITGISIPLIKNIQYQQKIKQFETYKSSLTAGAKLYNNSYSIDLFGKRRSGCAIISYDELKKRNLLKDIKMKNVKCDTSAIVVNKYLDSFYYKPSLVCISGTTVVYPKNGSPTSAYCPGDGEASMDIVASPSSKGNFDIKQVENIKIRIDSATGNSLKNEKKPKVAYLFTINSTLTDADYNGSWNTLNFGNPKPENEQLNLIKSGEVIQYGIGKITLKDLSGTIYLYVRVNDLYNLSDEKWEPGSGWTTNGEYHYKKIGTYKIDNENPTVTITELKSINNNYNHLKANLKITASDTYTSTNSLKMCTAVDTNTCTSASNITNAFTATKELTMGTKYDGSTHTAYVSVKDTAGNISIIASKTYKVGQEYTLTYDSDGGSACSPTTKKGIGGDVWGTLCSTTRTGATFGGWYTEKNGSGTNVTANSKISGNITVYAKWIPKTVEVTFNCNGGTSGGGTQTFTYGVSGQKFSTTCSRTGYTLSGWNLAADGSSNNYGVTSGVSNDWIDAHSPSVTVYAKWSINTYTITYNGNGNTEGSTAATTCNYNTDCTLRGNGFTKTNYTFAGWFTAASGGSRYGASTKITSNITVYAHWVQTTTEYTYTGVVKSYITPEAGIYQLIVYGAQGGNGCHNGDCGSSYIGGKGGKSSGNVSLSKGVTLYIVVGGKGTSATKTSTIGGAGGYNGGGKGGNDNNADTSPDDAGGGGGGATHIAKVTGILKDINNANNLYIVAGGGGGGAWGSIENGGKGGSGGGSSGTRFNTSCGTVGSQTGGYKFGLGENGLSDTGGGGGAGGGLYGGKTAGSIKNCPGPGGSGYIGGVTSGSTSTEGRSGNGYAKINYLGP